VKHRPRAESMPSPFRAPTSYALNTLSFFLWMGMGLFRTATRDRACTRTSMYLLLWVAVSLVGADRLAHARNRTSPLPSCSSSPRFATELGTQILHAADSRTAASAVVVVTTARDGCHALARPMNHAAARLTHPGGGVMTSFLLESPDRHYQTKPPATCTVRSRRHGHSKASARAIRAGRDITAQGGWRCTWLYMSPIRIRRACERKRRTATEDPRPKRNLKPAWVPVGLQGQTERSY
jgi:hypothetical protein